MRILSNADVEQLLEPGDCIADLEAAYRELALEQAANRPRNHTFFPVHDEDHPGFRFRFSSQEGGNLSAGVGSV
jgi:alanine dehydrogenase